MSKTDNSLYNDENNSDEFQNLTVFKSKTGSQPLKVFGKKTKTDHEFEKRLAQAEAKLTPVEDKIFKLVMKGYSIREAAEWADVSQQRAQQCWDNIREKLH